MIEIRLLFQDIAFDFFHECVAQTDNDDEFSVMANIGTYEELKIGMTFESFGESEKAIANMISIHNHPASILKQSMNTIEEVL